MRSDTRTAAELQAVVDRYLSALERFDIPAVLDCFTEDAFYSHPPYRDGEPRHEVQGHQAMVRLFDHRGPRPEVSHSLSHSAIEGDDGFITGTFLRDGVAVGSFVSTVTLATDGRIARYAAYTSVPPVGSNPA